MTNPVAYQKPYPKLDPNRMVGRDGKRFIVDPEFWPLPTLLWP